MIEQLGYYTYTSPVGKRRELMNACVQYGVLIYHIEETRDKVLFRVPLTSAGRIEAILSHVGASFTRSAPRGLAGAGYRLLRHPGLMIGILLSVLLYLFLNSMIWEVRILSRTDIDEDHVRQLLAECGLSEGSLISRLDEDDLVADYLMRDERIAFAAVHIRGVVAEVEIIPYKVKEEPQNKGEPCNIVATEDALITDITVYAGRAMVKVGETVHKGDILVSGVVTDVTGTHLVHAAADIRGERSDEIQVVSPNTVLETVIAERHVAGVGIRLFGRCFSLGHTAEDAEITQERKQIYLFGKIRLPLEITTSYRCVTETRERAFTEEEQIRRAEGMLEERMEELLGDGALLGYETRGELCDDGYRLSVHMVFENNIGKPLAFQVENQ